MMFGKQLLLFIYKGMNYKISTCTFHILMSMFILEILLLSLWLYTADGKTLNVEREENLQWHFSGYVAHQQVIQGSEARTSFL